MVVLADLADRAPGTEVALETFLAWTAERGFDLYPAQEEALLEVFSNNHVILATPTGSGKSLVALGAHVAALSSRRRSFYTAPIKALVSEKFFALCEALGAGNVGMLTGDAAINPSAPVVCATAEIVANMALRHGSDAPIDQVVMDEFHFYGDAERGWAWQVPLIELTGAQFVLMSATLGDTSRIEEALSRRTGRSVAVVRSRKRPVPLSFSYRHTPLHETIDSLLQEDQAPLYVVHFTQAAALAHAQALTSSKVATRAERDEISEAIGAFRFAPGFGPTLARLVRQGIGVHHGGMLPKYRRLVERLTQAGLLRVVVGTDTLGVGVNLPLRTVVMTGLSKYDGTTSRLLTAREFHQIAGRAGRAGYDVAGLVVVQAPEHEIDNQRALERAGEDARRRRRVVRSSPPKGFVAWDEVIFRRLVDSPPEPLTSQFRVSHAMLLNVLDRPGDGAAALRRLLTDNDEPRAAQRRHVRRAIAIYRSLLAAGALERLERPDELGRRIRVTGDLQSDFALDSPLSPFVLEAVPLLDADADSFALDVVSVVEATLDNPGPVLFAQLQRVRTETLQRLKAEGVEYEERLEILDGLEYPKPLREWTYQLFDAYRAKHPWAAETNIAPKSIARELYERAMTFAEYVAAYGLTRSEGLLLRYLVDAYKGLVRNVPEDRKSEELLDLTEWLRELARQVDSSLLDEWELLASTRGDEQRGGARPLSDLEAAPELERGRGVAPSAPTAPEPALSANRRALFVMVRNAAFRRVELAARRDVEALAAAEGPGGLDAAGWASALEAYAAEHGAMLSGAPARARELIEVSEHGRSWSVRQVLDDEAGFHDAAILGVIDLDATDEAGTPVWRTVGIELV
jgi:hypothetical protein